MPISKDRISSPLEAGTSILEMKQLPPQLTSALDYVSSRLARKGIHLSMIVVRKEVNVLPSSFTPHTQTPGRAASPGSSVSTSPARSLFSSASSTLTKSLSKHSSSSSLSDSASSSSTSTSPSLSRSKWPGLPSSPKDVNCRPSPPLSPAPRVTPLSPPTSPTTMNPYGISLMQTSALTAKVEKSLRRTIEKAEKKFSVGSGWLSSQPLTSLPSCPHTLDLVTKSLLQRDVIFSKEALTLLALDHLYTFKSTLHTYSRTLSPEDLTSAVDALRRLVLSRKGDKVAKGDLMKQYEWLGVSLAALVDVNEGYKTAYGGMHRDSGVDMGFEDRSRLSPMMSSRVQHLPKLGLKTDFGVNELRRMRFNVGGGGSLKSSSSNVDDDDNDKSPIERKYEGEQGGESPLDKEVEVGESAKGRDDWGMRLSWKEDRGPHRRGPVTPNGFEDITPVTKGEWCFLMVGEGWKAGRRGAVETCG